MTDNIQILQLLITALSAGILGCAIYFFISYKNRYELYRNKYEILQTTFEMELSKAKAEMQEQSFVNISREIHDNVMQMLYAIKLHLEVIKDIGAEGKKKINENQEYIDQVVKDLRALTESLKPKHIILYGLENAIEGEVKRVNNTRMIPATFVTEGEPYSLGPESDLIFFRIFQEGLNNAIKYSKAKQVNISLEYQHRLVTLTITDNGIGFSPEMMLETGGDGLTNIKKRATLIGAEATIDSSPGNGCSIRVTLDPYTELLYTTPESQN